MSSMMGIDVRTTMDIDIALTNRNLDENTVRELFENISSVASVDSLSFELTGIEEIKIEDQYPGYRVSLIGRLQNIRQPFSIDIATGDPITPYAIEYNYKSVFDSSNEIKVFSYNLETIIAEKLETVVSRKTANSRSKDFYDLYITYSLHRDSIDYELLKEAIKTTFDYRKTELSLHGIIRDLGNIQKDPGFRKRWETYRKKNPYVGESDFDKVIDGIKKLVIEINI